MSAETSNAALASNRNRRTFVRPCPCRHSDLSTLRAVIVLQSTATAQSSGTASASRSIIHSVLSKLDWPVLASIPL